MTSRHNKLPSAERPVAPPKVKLAPEKPVPELTLESLLADELVRLTMASDGVSPEEVRALAGISPHVETRL